MTVLSNSWSLSMWKKAGIVILKISLISLALLFLFIVSVYIGVFGRLEHKKELLSFKNETASTVLSSEGDLIGKFFTENRTNITYGQIPGHLVNALIATEDARFFEHGAIDSKSLFRVLLKTIFLQKQSSGGGVQYVSNWLKTCLAGAIMVHLRPW